MKKLGYWLNRLLTVTLWLASAAFAGMLLISIRYYRNIPEDFSCYAPDRLDDVRFGGWLMMLLFGALLAVTLVAALYRTIRRKKESRAGEGPAGA